MLAESSDRWPACLRNDNGVTEMKVVYHSTVGRGTQSRFASLEEQGIYVINCAESDRKRLKTVLADADVLWHLLDP